MVCFLLLHHWASIPSVLGPLITAFKQGNNPLIFPRIPPVLRTRALSPVACRVGLEVKQRGRERRAPAKRTTAGIIVGATTPHEGMTDGHLFHKISLVGREGANLGEFRVYSGGITWKSQGSGKIIEIGKDDIVSVTWMKIPGQYHLGISINDGFSYKFIGFCKQDVSKLTNFVQKNIGVAAEEKQLSVSGHNWGEVDINGNMLKFMVGSKQAFEIPLADVSQTQLQGTTDVNLKFHVDEIDGVSENDSLMELSFHIPTSNAQFSGDENRSPAQVLQEKIMALADLCSSEEAVVTFEDIAILTPRGRYAVKLHLSFLRLQGQATDFKIQYTSIVRLFLLPKSHEPHTFVVITLYPPIRKGKTSYPHIVIQFRTEDNIKKKLSINEDLLATKYKGKLHSSYKELKHDVFTKILRGLSGAKVTRPGSFRSFRNAFQVKSALKAEDGVMYPLEKGFFFLPKPPTLIVHDEIKYIKFEQHGAGVSSIAPHYFDLLVKLKNDQEHMFRNIQRNEYQNLFQFIKKKGLKILNHENAQTSNGASPALDDGDVVDPHLERIKNAAREETDEEILKKDAGLKATSVKGTKKDGDKEGSKKKKDIEERS